MINPVEMMTESDFGLTAGDMPDFSDDLVRDVQCWLERELTPDERSRLRDLCRK